MNLRTPSTTPDRLDVPTGDALFERLFPPLPTGVHWGLERTRAALADLGDPHRRFRSIHVGGTNGKGSVAATVESVLGFRKDRGSTAPGPRGVRPLLTGLYTSPHLCSVTERFQIGGRPVDAETLVRYADQIREVVLARELTFFEALTVLAFHLFASERIDVVVAEVGLGGRLDATNVLTPMTTGITNVAMDHAEYLGDTLEAIAVEKAGIIKAGVPAFVAEPDPMLQAVFERVAGQRRAPLEVVGPDRIRGVEVGRDRTSFGFESGGWGMLDVVTPLVGRHQAANTALAIALLDSLPPELRPDRDRLLEGVRNVRWPGRDQIEVIDGATWFFDVAHNTAGVGSLIDTLDRVSLPRPWSVVVAVLGDKEWDRMLPPLFERCDTAVLSQPPAAPLGRRWEPEVVYEAVKGHADGSGCALSVETDFDRALETAAAAAGEGTVVVTGSVYTVGGAFRALGVEAW